DFLFWNRRNSKNQKATFESAHPKPETKSHLCVDFEEEVGKMDGHDSEDPKQSTADMTAFVQNLLQQMMGNRIEELEQSINELRAEMGVDGSPSPSTGSLQKTEGS
ncbi:hypothetical protein RJ641_004248, partial [Dillenia turbinata]